MGYLEDTAKATGEVAKASTKSAFAAVSILAIPLLELVLLAGLVIAIVDIPRRLLGE